MFLIYMFVFIRLFISLFVYIWNVLLRHLRSVNVVGASLTLRGGFCLVGVVGVGGMPSMQRGGLPLLALVLLRLPTSSSCLRLRGC